MQKIINETFCKNCIIEKKIKNIHAHTSISISINVYLLTKYYLAARNLPSASSGLTRKSSTLHYK